MASSIKVGIAALVMLAAITGTAGRSDAGFDCFGCRIQIDDLTDTGTPTVKVFQGATDQSGLISNLLVNGELLSFSLFLSSTTPVISQTRYADLLEGVAGGLSDRVLVQITAALLDSQTFQSFRADVKFASDPDSIPLPTGALAADTLVENGTFQDLPILASIFGSAVTSFQVRSDTETVPEPSTLVLLGAPLAALVGMAWRRQRRP